MLALSSKVHDVPSSDLHCRFTAGDGQALAVAPVRDSWYCLYVSSPRCSEMVPPTKPGEANPPARRAAGRARSRRARQETAQRDRAARRGRAARAPEEPGSRGKNHGKQGGKGHEHAAKTTRKAPGSTTRSRSEGSAEPESRGKPRRARDAKKSGQEHRSGYKEAPTSPRHDVCLQKSPRHKSAKQTRGGVFTAMRYQSSECEVNRLARVQLPKSRCVSKSGENTVTKAHALRSDPLRNSEHQNSGCCKMPRSQY
jgi:hypothetical protein